MNIYMLNVTDLISFVFLSLIYHQNSKTCNFSFSLPQLLLQTVAVCFYVRFIICYDLNMKIYDEGKEEIFQMENHELQC